MSQPPLSIVLVGELDPHSKNVIADMTLPDLRCVDLPNALPAMLTTRPADVVLIAMHPPGSLDATLLDQLRQQDAAQNRYTCVVQCLGPAPFDPSSQIIGVDDVVFPADAQALRIRLALFGRVAALETQVLQKRPSSPGDVPLQDRLTGLGNWRYLTNCIENLLLETRDRGGLVCCTLISIDRFEHITRHHGQLARNELLRGVATRLRKALRPTDVMARTSDNEFGIALRYSDNRMRSWIFERLLRTVSYPPFLVAQEEREITISAGMGCSDGKGEVTPFDLLAIAGSKMREAQAAGGNTMKT